MLHELSINYNTEELELHELWMQTAASKPYPSRPGIALHAISRIQKNILDCIETSGAANVKVLGEREGEFTSFQVGTIGDHVNRGPMIEYSHEKGADQTPSTFHMGQIVEIKPVCRP